MQVRIYSKKKMRDPHGERQSLKNNKKGVESSGRRGGRVLNGRKALTLYHKDIGDRHECSKKKV